ncbi:MAG: response regulator transcription factor [Duganella sp.]
MRLDSKTWSVPTAAISTGTASGAMYACGQPITVRVSHADAIVNAGLAALLAGCSDVTLLHASEPVADQGVDVIITDHKTGLALMQQASRSQPGAAAARVLIVTQLDREWEVRTAMVAGVHGYLLQNSPAEQLHAAVRTLGRGNRYLSAELSRCVADSFTRTGLTSRETDVLQLLAQGQCNKSIARELGIGVGTVKTHVKGLFDKLGATARTHAVVLATRRGLVGEHAQRQH